MKANELIEIGYQKAIQDFKIIIQEWVNAYPTDVFTEVNPQFTKAITDQKGYDTLITRCSAAMGRHMSSRIMQQIDELMEGEDDSA